MSEVTKDMIKFVAEVIVLLIIFSVVFSPEGIATNTFNYFVFAEPMLLQNYIASALTVGSQTKGEFSTNIKLTSGLPHTVKIFFKEGIPYVNVIPAEGGMLKTTFGSIDPTPIITSCTIHEQAVKLPKAPAQEIRIKKVFENEKCELTVMVGTGTKSPVENPPCSDGTPSRECSPTDAPKYCEAGRIINKCAICGCPSGGYVCNANSEDCELKTFKLTVYTLLEKYGTAVVNVPVTLDGITKTTDANGKYEFSATAWSHSISVDKIFGSREFSHYRHEDCDPTIANYEYDAASNPYSFNVQPRDMALNIFYKLGTQIINLNYVNAITGELLDENNQPLLDKTPDHTTCAVSTAFVNSPVNRNISLEYFDGSAWNIIDDNFDTLNDGSFSYIWSCPAGFSSVNIRANYTPVNWLYMGSYKEATVTCPLCGNNVIEGSEQCDGTALGGQSCIGLGYAGGALSCKSDCTFDTNGCTFCTPGTVSICHTNYPDGSYDAACSANHWSRSTCNAGYMCKEGSCKNVDADLTSYTLPSGTFARSDAISIPYTIRNVGDIAWTFLSESVIIRSDSSRTYPKKWDTLNSGTALSNTITYNIGCSESLGTWQSYMYVFTDAIVRSGWQVYPSTPTTSFSVVQCKDNNDCQTCLGSNYWCNAGSCAVCGNNIKEGTEQCDGTALGGQSCIGLGYAGGALSCKSDCTFDTSGCYLGCSGTPSPCGVFSTQSSCQGCGCTWG